MYDYSLQLKKNMEVKFICRKSNLLSGARIPALSQVEETLAEKIWNSKVFRIFIFSITKLNILNEALGEGTWLKKLLQKWLNGATGNMGDNSVYGLKLIGNIIRCCKPRSRIKLSQLETMIRCMK